MMNLMIFTLEAFDVAERIYSLFNYKVDRDRIHTYADIRSLWCKYNIAFKKKTRLFYLHKIHMALIAEMNRINSIQEIDWVLNFEVIRRYVSFLREKRNGDYLIFLSDKQLSEDRQLNMFLKRELDKVFCVAVTPHLIQDEMSKMNKAKEPYLYVEFEDIIKLMEGIMFSKK